MKSFNMGRDKSRCPFSQNFPIIICRVLLCKDTKKDKYTPKNNVYFIVFQCVNYFKDRLNNVSLYYTS